MASQYPPGDGRERRLGLGPLSTGGDVPSIPALLDAWKARNGVKTDTEAAQRLGVSKQGLSHWRQRGSVPQAAVVVRLCVEAGIDPLAFLEAMKADRTDCERDAAQPSLPFREEAARAA